jgi:hypothetical protein
VSFPTADLTATAALVVAGIALALAIGAVAVVAVVRAELKLLRRQLGAGDRPLLIDVLVDAPVPSDMAGPSMETELPGIPPRRFDPRTVFVSIEAGRAYLSVPLRNVGRGLAVVDRDGAEIEGAGLGGLEYRAIRRRHVPVNETTRVDLVAVYDMRELERVRDAAWRLTVPYTDFAGEQRTVARLGIACRGQDAEGTWEVVRVDQESGDREPSRVAAPPLPSVQPEPVAEGPRDAAAPGQQQVTDIWGYPISKRRRRR